VRVDQCVSAVIAVDYTSNTADRFVLEWHIGSQNASRLPPGHSNDTRQSVLSTLRSTGKWESRGGHMVSGTKWLQSRDLGLKNRTVCEARSKGGRLKSRGLRDITRDIRHTTFTRDWHNATCGIRTRNPSKGVALDLQLKTARSPGSVDY